MGADKCGGEPAESRRVQEAKEVSAGLDALSEVRRRFVFGLNQGIQRIEGAIKRRPFRLLRAAPGIYGRHGAGYAHHCGRTRILPAKFAYLPLARQQPKRIVNARGETFFDARTPGRWLKSPAHSAPPVP
jgi:hypothetical protein